MDKDLEVIPEPEFDVNVQDTAEMLAVDRGMPDVEFSTYEQEMLQVYVRRDGVKYQFSVPANLVMRQEELEELLHEKLDDIEEQIESS